MNKKSTQGFIRGKLTRSIAIASLVLSLNIFVGCSSSKTSSNTQNQSQNTINQNDDVWSEIEKLASDDLENNLPQKELASQPSQPTKHDQALSNFAENDLSKDSVSSQSIGSIDGSDSKYKKDDLKRTIDDNAYDQLIDQAFNEFLSVNNTSTSRPIKQIEKGLHASERANSLNTRDIASTLDKQTNEFNTIRENSFENKEELNELNKQLEEANAIVAGTHDQIAQNSKNNLNQLDSSNNIKNYKPGNVVKKIASIKKPLPLPKVTFQENKVAIHSPTTNKVVHQSENIISMSKPYEIKSNNRAIPTNNIISISEPYTIDENNRRITKPTILRKIAKTTAKPIRKTISNKSIKKLVSTRAPKKILKKKPVKKKLLARKKTTKRNINPIKITDVKANNKTKVQSKKINKIAKKVTKTKSKQFYKNLISQLKNIKTKPFLKDTYLMNSFYFVRNTDKNWADIAYKIYGKKEAAKLLSSWNKNIQLNAKASLGRVVYYNSPFRPQDKFKMSYFEKDFGLKSNSISYKNSDKVKQIEQYVEGSKYSFTEVFYLNVVNKDYLGKNGVDPRILKNDIFIPSRNLNTALLLKKYFEREENMLEQAGKLDLKNDDLYHFQSSIAYDRKPEKNKIRSTIESENRQVAAKSSAQPSNIANAELTENNYDLTIKAVLVFLLLFSLFLWKDSIAQFTRSIFVGDKNKKVSSKRKDSDLKETPTNNIVEKTVDNNPTQSNATPPHNNEAPKMSYSVRDNSLHSHNDDDGFEDVDVNNGKDKRTKRS